MDRAGVLEFEVQGESTRLTVRPTIVALTGFTGRDRASVKAHLDELARIGVAVPTSWPVVYPITADRVTTGSTVEVLHEETSGELEFVVILQDGERYIGVGSDHTDRRTERLDISVAKQVVQRVVGPQVWRFEDVADRWDTLWLQSYVIDGEDRRLYQSSPVAHLLGVDDVVECVRGRCRRPLSNAVIFGGTVPLLDGEVSYAPEFEMEIVDREKERRLHASYRIVVNDWLIP